MHGYRRKVGAKRRFHLAAHSIWFAPGSVCPAKGRRRRPWPRWGEPRLRWPWLMLGELRRRPDLDMQPRSAAVRRGRRPGLFAPTSVVPLMRQFASSSVRSRPCLAVQPWGRRFVGDLVKAPEARGMEQFGTSGPGGFLLPPPLFILQAASACWPLCDASRSSNRCWHEARTADRPKLRCRRLAGWDQR